MSLAKKKALRKGIIIGLQGGFSHLPVLYVPSINGQMLEGIVLGKRQRQCFDVGRMRDDITGEEAWAGFLLFDIPATAGRRLTASDRRPGYAGMVDKAMTGRPVLCATLLTTTCCFRTTRTK